MYRKINKGKLRRELKMKEKNNEKLYICDKLFTKKDLINTCRTCPCGKPHKRNAGENRGILCDGECYYEHGVLHTKCIPWEEK